MFRLRLAVVMGSVATAVPLSVAATGADRQQGGGQRGGAAGGAPIGGTLTPKKADERGWGWQVKAMMNPTTALRPGAFRSGPEIPMVIVAL